MLDVIYLQIISHFLVPRHGQSVASPYYIAVIGSMLFLRDPLPISVIARFTDLDPTDVSTIIKHLQSIVAQPNNSDGPPRFHHKSFYGYLTSARCTEPALRFCKSEREAFLAQRCLIILANSLRENMADIQNSTANGSTMFQLAKKSQLR
jgi:hypothetical protein